MLMGVGVLLVLYSGGRLQDVEFAIFTIWQICEIVLPQTIRTRLILNEFMKFSFHKKSH